MSSSGNDDAAAPSAPPVISDERRAFRTMILDILHQASEIGVAPRRAAPPLRIDVITTHDLPARSEAGAPAAACEPAANASRRNYGTAISLDDIRQQSERWEPSE